MGCREFTEAEIEKGHERARPLRATPKATTDELVTRIALAHGITREVMLSRVRTPLVARARTALYVELRALGWSYPEIGTYVGRDHTTVMFAVKGDPRKNQGGSLDSSPAKDESGRS